MNRKQQEARQFRSTVKLSHPVHLLAVGLGSGMSRKMPGTIGSLAAIPLWFIFFTLPPIYYWLLMIFFFAIGCYFCHKTSVDTKTHDSSHIVWDEFVGMWITLFFIPEPSILWITVAFLAFRLFDIIKPWPISWIDRRVHGGFGIMIDDVIAAVFAVVVLLVIQLSSPITEWLNQF